MVPHSFNRVLTAALALAALAAGAAPRSATVLQRAPVTRMAPAQLAAFCAALRTPCTPAETTAYVARGGTDGPLWLIDASRPMFVALDAAEPLRADRATLWDFAEHAHTHPPAADGGRPSPLRLHPALYPVGATGFAVAVLSENREAYSGGGASFETADFVVLDAARTVAYGAVPFSCNRMIRACFTERDYRKSAHCHDESNGALTIRYPDGPGRWGFTWHESDWPSDTPRSRATSTRTSFEVPPGNTGRADAVSFCGGPLE